jgi:NAD(P)H-dependent FMN reductase
MNTPLKVKIILGSTRQGRFGDKPAMWILDEMKKKEGVEVEMLDLRDYPMPFFEEPASPNYTKEPFKNPVVMKWTQKIAEADAFIMLSPEYNHAYSAVLKNAIDYVGKEWNKKAVGFVSWGSVGGARAIEQLRQVTAEVQLASVRASVHIPWDVYMAVVGQTAPVNPELFAPVAAAKDALIEQVIWWGSALKVAREADQAAK